MICYSVKEENGLDELREALEGKITTVAGPSGVGKSSLINKLQSEVEMEVGDLSAKIERGKQTTRHTELIPVNEETYIFDTPGFSTLFVPEVEPEELGVLFPEFREPSTQCKFRGCAHMAEPGCKVKEAVENGSISASRYENYRLFYEERKNTKKY
jgi:ribosome biogenesis GTPase